MGHDENKLSPCPAFGELVKAASEAAETFAAYAQHHAAKGPGHEEKAERNAQLARKLRAAISSIEPVEYGPFQPGLYLPTLVYDAGGDVRIQATRQMDGRTLWKVFRQGNVLSKTGEWEWEPFPSSRDDEFLARCRFDTPQSALDCLRKSQQDHKPEARDAAGGKSY